MGSLRTPRRQDLGLRIGRGRPQSEMRHRRILAGRPRSEASGEALAPFPSSRRARDHPVRGFGDDDPSVPDVSTSREAALSQPRACEAGGSERALKDHSALAANTQMGFIAPARGPSADTNELDRADQRAHGSDGGFRVSSRRASRFRCGSTPQDDDGHGTVTGRSVGWVALHRESFREVEMPTSQRRSRRA